jgi:hypothetical protein
LATNDGAEPGLAEWSALLGIAVNLLIVFVTQVPLCPCELLRSILSDLAAAALKRGVVIRGEIDHIDEDHPRVH